MKKDYCLLWIQCVYIGKTPAKKIRKISKLLAANLTKYQYVNGTRNPDIISPDSWNLDQFVLDRPGNKEIQLALFYDYQNNLKQYPTWHEYFRINQPLH